MTHEVTVRNNGKAELAYIGARPWHGLGNALTEGATIDTWIAEAGMDWQVKRAFVRYQTEREGKDVRVMKDRVVLFRSDTGDALGVVSEHFKVVQPRDVIEFFRELCAHNHFKLETAGTLFGGARCWAQASIGEESYVAQPNDKVRGKLLLVTACDGTLKTTAKFVSERVVCNNTLRMALGEAHGATTVKVSHRSTFNPHDVKTNLGVGRQQFATFMDQMRALARVKVDRATVDRLTTRTLAKVGADVEVPELDLRDLRESRPYQTILRLFDGAGQGAQLLGAQGTAWGWLNAVTEYVDHRAPARNENNRFNSALFGVNDELKAKAAELALELVR